MLSPIYSRYIFCDQLYITYLDYDHIIQNHVILNKSYQSSLSMDQCMLSFYIINEINDNIEVALTIASAKS